MAVVTRYFSLVANPGGDGSGDSWTNRAAFLSSGAYSSIIYGFDFSGSDSLVCLVEGANTYSVTASLLVASFTVAAPTSSNPITFHACDSSGNIIEPPDVDWNCAQPAWDDSSLPTIETSTVRTSRVSFAKWRMFKFATTGSTAGIMDAGAADWCQFESSASNAATVVLSGTHVSNSVVSCTASSYSAVLDVTTASAFNVRVVGAAGSSGNRVGVLDSGNSRNEYSLCIVIGVGGHGFSITSSSTGTIFSFDRLSAIKCGGDGIRLQSAASQTIRKRVNRCLCKNNGGYGINTQGSPVSLVNCRAGNNTSGSVGNLGNYSSWSLNTDSITDGDEFVSPDASNPENGDWRIKKTSPSAGNQYGAGEEDASGGGLIIHPGMGGGVVG